MEVKNSARLSAKDIIQGPKRTEEDVAEGQAAHLAWPLIHKILGEKEYVEETANNMDDDAPDD